MHVRAWMLHVGKLNAEELTNCYDKRCGCIWHNGNKVRRNDFKRMPVQGHVNIVIDPSVD